MTKVAFFNVDEKEQAILLNEFTGSAEFELRFHQKSLDKHTACIARSERAILTPHNAFNTSEALERILTTSVENIKAFFMGSTQNIVNIS